MKSGRAQTHDKVCTRHAHALARKAVGEHGCVRRRSRCPPSTPDLVKLVNHVTSKKRGEADCLTRKLKEKEKKKTYQDTSTDKSAHAILPPLPLL